MKILRIFDNSKKAKDAYDRFCKFWKNKIMSTDVIYNGYAQECIDIDNNEYVFTDKIFARRLLLVRYAVVEDYTKDGIKDLKNKFEYRGIPVEKMDM